MKELSIINSSITPKDAWDTLSLKDKAEMIKVAVRNGITDLKTIRGKYNEFAEGGDTVGEFVNAIYENNPREEYLGEPSHHYDFTQSEEWADAHGYYPDARGHRDDRVKKVSHPSHSSRGTWDRDKFILTDFGMETPNYTLFGLNDGGQDPQATLIYDNGIVLPEFTVTPRGNYIENSYDNIRLHYAKGGKIHIKPENRGKFTALKERTGHSATWFKEHGTPAQKKMATFALNARRWKHGFGGNLFDGTSQPTQKMQIGLDVQGWPNYTTKQIIAYGEENEKRRKAIQDAYLNFVTESNDAIAVANGRPQNQHLVDRAVRGAKANAAWEKKHPNLTAWGNVTGAVPFAVASVPLGASIVTGGDALAATTAGQAVTAGLVPLHQAVTSATIAGAPALTWADAGLTSIFGAHGIQQAVEEGGISPMTALEVAPLGRLVKPMAQEATSAAKTLYDNGTLWDAYTTFGGRFGNYGDNVFTNMYGTAARRFGLPDKARVPADGIRKIKEAPRMSEGKIDFTGNKNWYGNPHVNATIDRGVVSHPAGGWDGADTYLFPFRDFLAETKGALKSIEPSDVFANGVAFMESPSKVTLISGDVTALENAQKVGMQTLSSPRLRRLYSEAEAKYNANKLLTKHPKKEQYWKEYADEVQRIQSQRGVPTLEDFRLLEQNTGLKTGIAPLSEYENAIRDITEMQKTMYKPGGIRAIMNGEAVPYTYPNGRKVDWTIQGVADELNALQRAKYNNVFYDPTTYTESIWRSESKPKW